MVSSGALPIFVAEGAVKDAEASTKPRGPEPGAGTS